jgi:uncharacterized membrane protein
MSDQNSNEPKSVSLQDLQNTVATKKKEAAEVKAQSAVLAEENKVPLSTDPDAMEGGDKFLASIGYFSFLCILPLVLRPNSAFCRFHGTQGLVMMAFFLIFGRIMQVLGMIAFGNGFWVHNFIVLIHVGMALYAIYFAYQGKTKELPIFGKFARTLKF